MYIVTEDVGKSVGIREGWNGGKTGGSAMQFDGERLGQLILRAV